MTSYADTDARFHALCRCNGWKCTAQRLAIFAILDGNTAHPTVDAVWTDARTRVPGISLDSVYRILNDFVAAGIIRKLESGRAARYDPDCKPHDHYICTCCGTLYDFAHAGGGGVEKACQDIGTVATVELVVRGVCRACQART